MNISSPCKIVKLSNGQDILCIIEKEFDKECKISNPLLMQIVPQQTPHGFVESLRLSKWVQPFTEDLFFKIKSNNIILVADASPELSRYYEHVLARIDEEDANELARDDEPEEEFEEEEEYLEDTGRLSKRLATKSDSIH